MATEALIDEWLSPAEVAKMASCTPDNVRVWARSGKLPAIRTHLGRLFDRETVQRFLAERQRRAE